EGRRASPEQRRQTLGFALSSFRRLFRLDSRIKSTLACIILHKDKPIVSIPTCVLVHFPALLAGEVPPVAYGLQRDMRKKYADHHCSSNQGCGSDQPGAEA
ncbi:MAG: hypothetical protein NTZ50_09800, partial [Chloroflexi bacterium]|nr:hypothetical protein [Chloroflexota bacterium]